MVLVILLSATVAAIWSTSEFYLHEKGALLDDAFIYLHIAENIVANQTAQYFPIAHNPSLLASAPLRLVSLSAGSAILSFLDHPLRTIDTARRLFLLAGILESLLFLPFFMVLKRVRFWFLGVSLLYLFGQCLETVLQMEGGLLFWVLFTLIQYTILEKTTEQAPIAFALLSFSTVLIRPEYGLLFVGWVLASLVLPVRRTQLLLVAGTWMGLSLLYIAVASTLGVWFVPTTMLAKASAPGMFSDLTFFDKLRVEIGYYFGIPTQGFLFWPLASVLALIPMGTCWMVRRRGHLRWIVAFGLTVVFILMLRGLPSNYLWYYENLFLVQFGLWSICAVTLWHRLDRPWVPMLLTLIMAGFLGSFLSASVQADRNLPWNFSGRSKAVGYQYVASQHAGNGLYTLLGSGGDRIQMCEIGIVSYLSGSTTWIGDACGLAQAGELAGVRQSFLRWFYPSSVIITARQEQQTVSRGDSDSSAYAVWALWEHDIPEARTKCGFVDEGNLLCINSID